MNIVVVEIVDHFQGADIVTHGLRVEGWSLYGPTREEAQKVADRLNGLLQAQENVIATLRGPHGR
jgi:hypothetical protein